MDGDVDTTNGCDLHLNSYMNIIVANSPRSACHVPVTQGLTSAVAVLAKNVRQVTRQKKVIRKIPERFATKVELWWTLMSG